MARLNNCRFNPTAGGTTDWTYSSAVAGYNDPVTAGAVTATPYEYFAISADGSQFEGGKGNCTIAAGVPTFARTTVLFNSSGTTAKITFSAAPQVAIVTFKDDLLSVDEANSFTAAQQALGRSNLGAVGAGFVNKFRNGTMDIWQRGTSALASAATTINGYQADGWITNNTFSAGAGPVMSQVANNRTGALTQWALKILGATNVTDVIFKQRIEGAVSAQFGTQTVTVQAQIFNNTGGSITPTLTVKYPTATDNYASTTTDSNISATSLQACANGAWTQVAYTFTPTGNVSLGMEVAIDFGNNFSSNAKFVNVTELDIRVTPGVSTGLNSVPPVPEMRPVPYEMAFCQRYYQSFLNPNATFYLYAYNVATATPTLSFALPVAMRAAPTGTVVGTWTVSNCNQPTINSSTPLSWSAFVTVSGTGAFVAQSTNAGNGVTFTAEL